MDTGMAVMVVTALVILILFFQKYPKFVQRFPKSDSISNVPDISRSIVVDRIVLDILWDKASRINYLDIWMSHNYDCERWRPILESEQLKIDALRTWAKSEPMDTDFRNAYRQWLDHFQRNIDSAWDELRSQKTKKSHDDSDSKRRLESQAIAKIMEEIDVPIPRFTDVKK